MDPDRDRVRADDRWVPAARRRVVRDGRTAELGKLERRASAERLEQLTLTRVREERARLLGRRPLDRVDLVRRTRFALGRHHPPPHLFLVTARGVVRRAEEVAERAA